MAQIIIAGLGPGAPGLITRETWDMLETVRPVFLRTAQHPAAGCLTEKGIHFSSFDPVYGEQETSEGADQAIVAKLMEQAKTHGRIVYAVPGNPLVAERTVALARQQAEQEGITVEILPGMSFMEVLYARLGLDPVRGVTVVNAADADKLPADWDQSIIITQLLDRRVVSEMKLGLMAAYSDEYEVVLVRNLGLPEEEIKTIPLLELDCQSVAGSLTSLYVPPRRQGESFSLQPLVDVMARLRSPGGCVWDLEQSHESLRRYIVEEVYEVLEAVEKRDAAGLCEELGDLLLQIVFHARIAEEFGEFTMQDVVDEVTEKMVRRHPHVFGDIQVRDAAEVVVNWDKIKKFEKRGERKSVLDGVSPGLPSLMRAFKLQAKASKVGFDWTELRDVKAKVHEEWLEVEDAIQTGSGIEAELGDLLFSVVNLARFLKVEPETALTATNNKFIRRFSYIEQQVTAKGQKWDELTLRELDTLWEEAKRREASKN